MTFGNREPPHLGRLEPLDPRKVWEHEARDFTPWLLNNADALGDALGLDIELTAAEHPVGPFFLDVIGRDLTNDCVLIVENQLSLRLITITSASSSPTQPTLMLER